MHMHASNSSTHTVFEHAITHVVGGESGRNWSSALD